VSDQHQAPTALTPGKGQCIYVYIDTPYDEDLDDH